MVRHSKQTGAHKVYTEDQKEAALELFKTKKITQVSRELGIPRSTLRGWVANPNIKLGSGHPTVFEPWEENLIIDVIVYLGEQGFPMGREEIKNMVQNYVKSSGKVTPFPNGRPGPDWTLLFEKRHKDRFTRRVREGLSYNRVASLTEENKDKFFDLYESILNETNLMDRPFNIWNLDESGFQACEINAKVYVGKDLKNAYSVDSPGGKQTYTVLFCVNAIGQYLPPYTIYKSANIWNTWMRGGPEGALYGFNKSGWMMDINFEAFFIKVFLPKTAELAGTDDRLLIFDGHNSHITFKTAKAAMENKVHLLCLPPHSSHALQPLDVSVFFSVKTVWSKVCLQYFKDHPRRVLSKEKFPSCLKIIYQHCVDNPDFPVNGFRKCGFRPFNRDAVNDKIRSMRSPRETQGNTQRQEQSRGERERQVLQKRMIESIREYVEANHAPRPNQAPTPRKRVQAVVGDILTSPENLERLEREQVEREAKEAKQAQKGTGRGKGRGKTSAVGPTPPGISGTMDQFVTRNKRPSVAQSDPEVPAHVPEGGADAEVQPGTEAEVQPQVPFSEAGTSSDPSSTGARPKTRGVKRSLYRELSNSEEENIDDPPPQPDKYHFADEKALRGMVKANVTYLIFLFEEQHFPALVVKKFKRLLHVRRMKPIITDSGIYTGQWYFQPESMLNVCEYKDVTDLIPPPTINSSSRNRYFLEKICQYWKRS